MTQGEIYLDNHATTRCDPRVVEAMLPFFSVEYGNAASTTHEFGRRAKDAVENARATIGEALGAAPPEVIFTSGATEANNLAIAGVIRRSRKKHVITVATEHPSVLEACDEVEAAGGSVTRLSPQKHSSPEAGRLAPQQVDDAIGPETALVSVMAANNEIGVLQPIPEIAAICRRRGVLFHVDAVQAVGKVPVDFHAWDVDLLSLSGHKIYGPKGIGALLVRRRVPRLRLGAIIVGGGHERGLRSGTLNVPGAVGLAEALRLCVEELGTESHRLRQLRDLLFARLSEGITGLVLNGPALEDTLRLPHNLNVRIEGIDGETLLMQLPDLAASSGAACSSATPEPSHVLRELGLSEAEARCSLRFGLGRFNTREEIERAAARLVAAVTELRGGFQVH